MISMRVKFPNSRSWPAATLAGSLDWPVRQVLWVVASRRNHTEYPSPFSQIYYRTVTFEKREIRQLVYRYNPWKFIPQNTQKYISNTMLYPPFFFFFCISGRFFFSLSMSIVISMSNNVWYSKNCIVSSPSLA